MSMDITKQNISLNQKFQFLVIGKLNVLLEMAVACFAAYPNISLTAKINIKLYVS